jgi:hypothetical protein
MTPAVFIQFPKVLVHVSLQESEPMVSCIINSTHLDSKKIEDELFYGIVYPAHENTHRFYFFSDYDKMKTYKDAIITELDRWNIVYDNVYFLGDKPKGEINPDGIY